MTKEILYYTDNKLKEPLFSIVQKQLLKSGLPIISVSLEPINFGKNIHYKGKRGYLTMFKQILAGLEVSIADAIFMCEHDVLYHPSHFDFTPPNKNGDINNDKKVNIIDFSIMLYFWQQRNPSNTCADINKDGIVNLFDFSIMLFWWTG